MLKFSKIFHYFFSRVVSKQSGNYLYNAYVPALKSSTVRSSLNIKKSKIKIYPFTNTYIHREIL